MRIGNRPPLSRRIWLAVAAALLMALAAPNLAPGADPPVVNPAVPAARDTEPVILTGASFGDWSAPANQTAKIPLLDFPEAFGCFADDTKCPTHNHYATPEVDTGNSAGDGTPTDRLLGYKWNGKKFVQIPFQVDEQFTRYLDNTGSGFSFYSGQDQHTTYAFDREGFRFTASDPNDPCKAVPGKDDPNDPTHSFNGSQPQPGGPATTPDPVKGLDNNDEVAFMASDAGAAAPQGTALPKGIEGARQVQIGDPTRPSDAPKVVYVMKAAADGPKPAFNADNGYVHYKRDANASTFEHSESSYNGYGNAAMGIVCDQNGNVIKKADGSPDIEKRRPRDYASIETNRFKFRYDGRWLLTAINISSDGGNTFGPDLVDRWKARAFQQDPSSETPCCGYEEEDTNWGGSSTLLGERSGPVRTIRETWGADSGTNVIRRETFYRDEVRQKSYLRVHVIPPLDGIYAQWDFNAGRMTKYYNPQNTAGVSVDGKNDELVGNLDDPCNAHYNSNDTSQLDQGYRQAYQSLPFMCDQFPYHQSIDVTDPTFGQANASLQWNVTAGQDGTIVDRYQIDKATDLTPGGAAQSLAAVPYYRDDSCFDDGTGTDPGPKLHLRSGDEPSTAADGTTRKCWSPSDGLPNGSDHYYQGDIGTHGLHLLFQAESDNARLTVPLDEIVSEQRLVMLPGQRDASVGEQYGRGFEKPLVAAALPYDSSAPTPKKPKRGKQ